MSDAISYAVRAEASFRPSLRRTLPRPRFGSARSVFIAPQMLFPRSHTFQNTARGLSQLHSFDTLSASFQIP